MRSKAFPNGTVELFDATGKLHNEGDMPASVAPDGSQAWFRNGKPHRDTGPAYIDGDGTVHFWLNGQFLLQDDSARKTTRSPSPPTTSIPTPSERVQNTPHFLLGAIPTNAAISAIRNSSPTSAQSSSNE